VAGDLKQTHSMYLQSPHYTKNNVVQNSATREEAMADFKAVDASSKRRLPAFISHGHVKRYSISPHQYD
jgi:hypothetical protein